jgi:hypothetical protein
MKYLGDITEDSTIRGSFNTRQADGTPITLAGTPSLAVYKDAGTTESTAGVTLTVDFDSITGLHFFTIDTSADAFYATGSDYRVVIAAGTVDGTSVVGSEVGSFSIENRYVPETVDANLTQILGWGLFEETSGNIGESFSVFFNDDDNLSNVYLGQLGNIPTTSEFEARTLPSAQYATAAINTEARLAKLDVAGTLANTDNADSFKATIGGQAILSPISQSGDDLKIVEGDTYDASDITLTVSTDYTSGYTGKLILSAKKDQSVVYKRSAVAITNATTIGLPIDATSFDVDLIFDGSPPTAHLQFAVVMTETSSGKEKTIAYGPCQVVGRGAYA